MTGRRRMFARRNARTTLEEPHRGVVGAAAASLGRQVPAVPVAVAFSRAAVR
jgi:hypothetical protein